jgi:phosphoglycolate phosphatase
MAHTPHLIPADALRLLVFDLDGTLIDSRKDLVNSVNAMLDHLDRPRLPDEVIASYIGDGAGMLVRRALGGSSGPGASQAHADEAYVEAALAYFLDYYRVHKLDHTHLYPGVLESLEALRLGPDGAARKMAVLTNKPVGPSAAICEALGLGPYFFRVYGGNSFATKKPDPQGLNALIREAGVDPFETLMIGDSEVDIRTARSAGAWALGCRFGLAPHTLDAAEPDCLVDSAFDWAEALDAAKAIR